MKNISFIFILSLGMLMVACGEKEEKPEDLVAVEAQLKDKKDQVRKLQDEIKELEQLKAKLDPSTNAFKPVRVDTVDLGNFASYYEVQATAETNQNITLSSEVNGVAQNIPVNEGQKVTKGQLLVNIDADVLLKNIEEVKTSLDLAKTAFERQKNLWEQNIGSEFQYLEAKNRKESLEKKLASLYAQYQKSNVRAPISGTVDRIMIKEGEMIMPGMPMFRIVNLDDMRIRAEISEARLGTVSKGDTVVVDFPSIPGYSQNAIVASVGQVINPTNRTFPIEVKLQNSNGLIKPNLLAVVKVKDYEEAGAIVINENIVQQDRQGNEFIFKVQKKEDDLIAQKTVIKTSKTFKGQTKVNEGLNKGDVIITDGSKEVSDNELIEIKN